MRLFLPLLVAMMSLVNDTGHAAEPPTNASAVRAVSGFLFDQTSGLWSGQSIFDPGYVPVNQMGIPVLLMVTVNLGERCVAKVVDGKLSPPTRPRECEKPVGQITAIIKHGSGQQETHSVPMSKFFSGFDGMVRVPVLFYRRLPCAPLELIVKTSPHAIPFRQKVDFSCME